MSEKRFFSRLLLAAGIVVALLFAWRILDVLLLAFGAVLIAILLRALGDLIERWTPLPDRWALLLAMLLVATLVGASLWMFGSEATAQISTLLQALPQAWEALQQRLDQNGWIRVLVQRLSGVGGAAGSGILSSVSGFAVAALGAATDLLLVIFGGIYFALQPRLYKEGIVKLFPKPAAGKVRETIQVSSRSLRLWLLGQLVAMVLVAILTTTGLWLVGLPSALALGLFAGLAEFVPIVGPVFAAVPALILALAQDYTMFLRVLGVYVVVQQVESNMIMPLIERQVVALPPALALFAVVAMGLLFGPLGVLFATPLTVLGFVVLRSLYVRDTLGYPVDVPGRPDPDDEGGPSRDPSASRD